MASGSCWKFSFYRRSTRFILVFTAGEGRDRNFWEASENTSLILLLPYAILMLYFSWRG